MFKKLPQELLAEANELLQEEIAGLRKELWHRAAPRVSEMITALGPVTQAAESGNHDAKVLLFDFFTAWRRAEAASHMATVPTKRPDHFEAPPGAESGEAVIVEPEVSER